MMKALVLYDSVFGNTEKIAQAVANSLDAEAVSVGAVDDEQLKELDLLVVGSPTRGFRPTEGITALLNRLQETNVGGVAAAAFDTRIVLESIQSKPLRFMVDKGGYAANRIAKLLNKKGCHQSAAPEGFFVTGEEGPLKEGELERAAAWGRSLLPS